MAIASTRAVRGKKVSEPQQGDALFKKGLYELLAHPIIRISLQGVKTNPLVT
jgi:hypothetical protein